MIKIEKRKVNNLKFYLGNPRKISKDMLSKLKRSIKEFGIVEPLVINKNNEVIGGNQRLLALKELGVEEVDVVVVDLPKNKEKALNLALNKITGEWDQDLLIKFIEDLNEDEIELAGFDKDEVSFKETDLLETEEDNYEEPEKLPKRVKRGEVWMLGNHRLMCGDATKLEDVEKLMSGEKADMVFSDPPYNIGVDYSKRLTTKEKFTGKKIFSDSKKESEYRIFLQNAIKNALRASKRDTHIFFWCDEKYIYMLQELYKENGIKLQRVNLWIKNNFTPTPQNAFNKVYEPCVYGIIGNPKLSKSMRNLTEILNKGLQKADDVYEYIFQGLNLWLEDREKVFNYQHPTQKPVTLCEKPIKRCTDVNDIVLDLFAGSGSTLIACEQLKRRAYLMELDEHYCDVIIDRWEKFTGKKAEKIIF